MEIRNAEIDDAYQINEVYVLTWKNTYKGIINDSFLNQLTNNKEDIRKREKDIKDNPMKYSVVVINNKVVGVMTCINCRNEKYKDFGEIQSLYVLKEYQGQGIGKALIEEGKRLLKQKGYNEMIIECLKENPSCLFYKAMGGKEMEVIDSCIANQILQSAVFYFQI